MLLFRVLPAVGSVSQGIGTRSERSLRGMGLAEAHYNRCGKDLRKAHGIFSAPCEVFYHAGTGEAVNCN